MRHDPSPRGRAALLLWVAVAVVVIVAVAIVGAFPGRAKITGDTPGERVRCIARLADRRPPGAAAALAAAAADEPDPGVRRAALVALSKLAGREHREVIEAAARDTDPDVRAGAAAALACCRDAAAADRLLEMARSDGDRGVRLAAVGALDPHRTDAAPPRPAAQQAAGPVRPRRLGGPDREHARGRRWPARAPVPAGDDHGGVTAMRDRAWITVSRPAARRPPRPAFTLVELLVVVAVIALLLSAMVPSLSATRSIARSTQCKANLRQIGQAFRAAGGAGGPASAGKAFPAPNAWPTIPRNVLPDDAIYQCPEKHAVHYSINEYYIHTNYAGGIDIAFAEDRDTGLCRVIEDNANSTLYGFEDGNVPDLWTGTVDVYIRVSKTIPQIGTNETQSYQGYSTGVLSLWKGGSAVPGWEDFRRVAHGATFVMASGNTSYGYNAEAHRSELPPDTVVVLDYPERVANTPVDSLGLSANLVEAARRHRGTLNLLFADGSARGMGPTEIDPLLSADNARRWTP